jgi:hypothetical protein
MKKFIFPSLILVLISVISLFFKSPDDQQIPGYLIIFFAILTFVSLVFIVRRYKNVYEKGTITFGKAFRYGVLVSLLYTVIWAVTYFVYLKLNEESFKRAMDTALNKMQAQRLDGYTSAGNEKRMNSIFALMSNPIIATSFTLIWTFLCSIFYSLIAAAIVKSKPEESRDTN